MSSKPRGARFSKLRSADSPNPRPRHRARNQVDNRVRFYTAWAHGRLHPPGPEPVRLPGCCGHRRTNVTDGIIARIGGGTPHTPCLMRHRCITRPESLCISKASSGFDSAIPRFESCRPSHPVRSSDLPLTLLRYPENGAVARYFAASCIGSLRSEPPAAGSCIKALGGWLKRWPQRLCLSGWVGA